MIKIVVICGPTASGKSELAMKLAKERGGEIVSADSGQVYRGCDIGTAKPSLEDRKKVPHHLIDVVNPDERFDAARFVALADAVIQDISKRGRLPIVVGGTGLYIKALLHGLFSGPPRDEVLRAELGERIKKDGIKSLHEELKKIDPVSAERIPENNRHRIIRALEVFRLTGRPISEYQAAHGFSEKRYDAEEIVTDIPRNELYKRINERVDNMMAAGWLAEAAAVRKKWGPGAPALNLLGYKELNVHLKDGGDLADVILKIKQRTRNYAKRQVTWFRCVWKG